MHHRYYYQSQQSLSNHFNHRNQKEIGHFLNSCGKVKSARSAAAEDIISVKALEYNATYLTLRLCTTVPSLSREKIIFGRSILLLC